MSTVTIYRFKVYNPQDDEFVLSQRWGTIQAIQKISGVAIEGTAVDVDETVMLNPQPDMQGLSERGFDPRPDKHGSDGG